MALPLSNFFGLEISINITRIFWVPTKLLQAEVGSQLKKKEANFSEGGRKDNWKISWLVRIE